MPAIQRVSSAFKIGDYVCYHYAVAGKPAKKVYQIVDSNGGSGPYRIKSADGWLTTLPGFMLKRLTDSELAWYLLTNGK